MKVAFLDVLADGFGQRLRKRQADEDNFRLQAHADHPLFRGRHSPTWPGVRWAVMSFPLREKTMSTGLPPLLLIMS
jgi:hypothetical protein